MKKYWEHWAKHNIEMGQRDTDKFFDYGTWFLLGACVGLVVCWAIFHIWFIQ